MLLLLFIMVPYGGQVSASGSNPSYLVLTEIQVILKGAMFHGFNSSGPVKWPCDAYYGRLSQLEPP
jgi:hypothetical protein